MLIEEAFTVFQLIYVWPSTNFIPDNAYVSLPSKMKSMSPVDMELQELQSRCFGIWFFLSGDKVRPAHSRI